MIRFKNNSNSNKNDKQQQQQQQNSSSNNNNDNNNNNEKLFTLPNAHSSSCHLNQTCNPNKNNQLKILRTELFCD